MVDREQDSNGVPYDEIFNRREIERLKFHRWIFQKNPEVKDPQSPLPEQLPLEEKKLKQRTRGVSFQKGWNKPGV